MTAGQGAYGGRKTREGTVVSDKMEKTVVVAVHSSIQHPLYKKTIRRVRKYMAHDEEHTAKMGDRVRIVESAPVSRHKRWKVAEVLTRVELPDIAPEAIDSTLVQELAAPVAPPATHAPASEPVVPPMQEEEPVQMDAGPEALETQEQTATAASVAPAEPEVPPMEEGEPVQMDAAPEATEEGA